MTIHCSWCGREVDPADSWVLADPAQRRVAVFCRLEHVVPWSIRGPRWTGGTPQAPGRPSACARCGAPLGPDALLLVRRRAGHELAEGFCGLEHVVAWAKAGGPWG